MKPDDINIIKMVMAFVNTTYQQAQKSDWKTTLTFIVLTIAKVGAFIAVFWALRNL